MHKVAPCSESLARLLMLLLVVTKGTSGANRVGKRLKKANYRSAWPKRNFFDWMFPLTVIKYC